MTMQHSNTLGPVREMSWESIAEPFQSMPDPRWEDIEARISLLETIESGSVFLKAKNGTTLSIGGDRGRGYLVFLSDGTGHRYLQAPPSRREGVINLVMGFQPADYPRRIAVDLDASLKAARTYFETGRILDGENWTVDCKTVEW
jgi:hypothetical protein